MELYPQEIEYAQTVALEEEFLCRIKPETELEKWIDNYISAWWKHADKRTMAIAFGMLHARGIMNAWNNPEWEDLSLLKSIAFDYAYCM